jgi:hypothetical protein
MKSSTKLLLLAGTLLVAASVVFFVITRPSELEKAILEDGRIEFLTLCAHPCDSDLRDETRDRIGENAVLDSRIIEDPTLILNMVDDLFYLPDDEDEEYPSCFWPRHAFRKVDDKNEYVLICFECRQFRHYLGGYWHGYANPEKEDLFKQVADELGMKSPYEELEEMVESNSEDSQK